MSKNKLKFEIPVKKYIKLISDLDKQDVDVADVVHSTLFKYLTPECYKTYFYERFK